MKTTPERARDIGSCVYTAMRDSIGIPEGDNFQILQQFERAELIFDPKFQGMERSEDGFMIIEITLARGREVAVKQSLFSRITELLEGRCQVRPDDVMILLHEVGQADISFGQGRAQFIENTPAHLQSLGTAPDSKD